MSFTSYFNFNSLLMAVQRTQMRRLNVGSWGKTVKLIRNACHYSTCDKALRLIHDVCRW